MTDPKPGDIRLWRPGGAGFHSWAIPMGNLPDAVCLADQIAAKGWPPGPPFIQRFESGGWVDVLPAELDEARRRLP